MQVLDRQLSALANQVDRIYLIDNGSPDVSARICELARSPEVEVVPLGENMGIGYAQNLGIRMASACQATHVLLMDQDSLPAPDMVEKLLAAEGALLAKGCRIAALGPSYQDHRQNRISPFMRIRGLRFDYCVCSGDTLFVEVEHLIASGTMIPLSVIDHVGAMREDFFIDYIDIEWSLRAKRHGYTSYGVCHARMEHTLGETPMDILGKKIPMHSPVRQYYQVRNAVRLYLDPKIPSTWKLVVGWRMLVKYALFSLFADLRLQRWAMMAKGVWHGATNRLGPIDRPLSR